MSEMERPKPARDPEPAGPQTWKVVALILFLVVWVIAAQDPYGTFASILEWAIAIPLALIVFGAAGAGTWWLIKRLIY